jgi:putrescine transport system substrate-binding protein
MNLPKTLVATLTVAALPFAAAAETVNLYGWAEYFDPDLLAAFTAETGIEVVYTPYDSQELAETRVLAGGAEQDVVVLTDLVMQRLREAGVLAPLDPATMPNLVNGDPAILAQLQAYDPGNTYAVPYMWGTTSVGYNVQAVEARLGPDAASSWAMVFDPAQAAKLADCGIVMIDVPEEIVPITLDYLGLNPSSLAQEDLARAEETLMAIRPYVLSFDTAGFTRALAEGEACVALGWSGDMLKAERQATESGQDFSIAYSIPKEGALLWIDVLVIPDDAPNPESARAFVNWMMTAERGAQSTAYVNFASGVAGASDLLSEDIRNNPAVFPDAAARETLFVRSASDAEELRDLNRMWTGFRTGE